MLVVPVNEQPEFIPESHSAHRGQQATCSLAFHRAHEALDDRDAAVLPNGAKAWLDLPPAAPGLEARAPELRSLVTDDVLGPSSSQPNGSVEKCPDVFRGREIAEDGETDDAT